MATVIWLSSYEVCPPCGSARPGFTASSLNLRIDEPTRILCFEPSSCGGARANRNEQALCRQRDATHTCGASIGPGPWEHRAHPISSSKPCPTALARRCPERGAESPG